MNTFNSTITKKWKFRIAAVATLGLIFAGVAPAYAATIVVSPGEVAPVEIGGNGSRADYNYHLWHIGNVGTENSETDPVDPGDVAIGEASFNFDDPRGITLIPNSVTGAAKSTQLLKGYHIDEIVAGEPFDTDELREFLDTISVEVAEGTVNLQIAGNFVGPSGDTYWTTLRPLAPHGTATAFGQTDWIGSNAVSPIIDDVTGTPISLEDMMTTMNIALADFQLYGVGVVTKDGAVVSSISFGGTTYSFAGPVDPVVPTPPSAVETAVK